MKAVTKEHYAHFWNEVNPADQDTISTRQIATWVSLLQQIAHENLKLDKQNKTKLNSKSKNKRVQKNKKQSQPEQQKQIEDPFNQQQIIQILKKYCESESYKQLTKNKQNQEKSNSSKGLAKRQVKLQKKVSKYKTKKQEQLNPITIENNLIDVSFSYEECIGFYYWFCNNKNLVQEYRNSLKSLQESGQINQSIQNLQQGKNYKSKDIPKKYFQLSEKQKQQALEDYLQIIKKYQANLLILFKHYSKVDHLRMQKYQSFQQMKHKIQKLNLHQFMLFGKNWNVLVSKKSSSSINSTISREQLLDVFHRNAFQRKEMTFDNFLKALVQISCKLFQNVDTLSFKPIDMLLNHLNVKQQQIFVKKLEQNHIKSKQSDFINCFKSLDKQSFAKLSLVKLSTKKQLIEQKRRYTEIQNIKYRIQASKNRENQKFQPLLSHQSDLFQSGKNNVQGQGQDKLNNKSKTYCSEMLGKSSSMPRIYSQQQNTQPQPSSSPTISNIFSKSNRKSAPSIGVNLPKIQNNRYFQPLQHNNHKNIYKGFLSNVPQSSSVFKNKITGYSKIHKLQLKQVHEETPDHQALSGFIDKKRAKFQNPIITINSNQFMEEGKIENMQNSSQIIRHDEKAQVKKLRLVQQLSIQVENANKMQHGQKIDSEQIKSQAMKEENNPQQLKQSATAFMKKSIKSNNTNKQQIALNRFNYSQMSPITHEEDNYENQQENEQEISSVYKQIINQNDQLLQKNNKQDEKNTTEYEESVNERLNVMNHT